MARARRVLIMPAGPFQVPAIREAHAMNLEVVAMDANPNAPGLAIADYPLAHNPSQVTQAIKLARDYSVNAAVSVASDPCLIPAAEICRAMELPGLAPEAARVARNKRLARDRLRQTLPQYCPRYCVLRSSEDLAQVAAVCGYPAVLKPSESNGSKGVIIANSERELSEAYSYAWSFSSSGEVLAEELLTGREVSVEGVVSGEIHLVAITDKTTTPPPFCVEIAHAVPSRLPPDTLLNIREAAEAIAHAFELDACAIHAELYVTVDGIKLVEFGARLGGGCITSHLVPLATGVNLTRAVITMALGETPSLAISRSQGAAIQFLRATPGRVVAIEGLEHARSLPGVVEIECPLTAGSHIHRLENSDHRFGYVIASGEDAETAIAAAQRAAAAIRIVTKAASSESDA